MRKRLLFIIIFSLVFLLVGCKEVVNIKYETVEVTIVDEYYKDSWLMPLKINKMTIWQKRPAVYRITVEYDNVEYNINGSDIYDKYKDKVGESTTGTLEIRTYDDESIRYAITELN